MGDRGVGAAGAAAALAGGVVLIGAVLAGNALVCLSVAAERALRTPTNYFILSLAAADLLLALLVLPLFVYSEVQGGVWRLSPGLCDLLMAMDVLLCTASIFNLCAISVDRFVAVALPLRYSQGGARRRLWLIGATWLLAAAVAAPLLCGLNDVRGRDPAVCRLEDRDYVLASSVCSFFLPCPLMLLLYWAAFRRLRRRGAERRAQLGRPAAPPGTAGAEGAGGAEDEAPGAGGAEGTGGTDRTGGAEDEAPGAGGAEGTGGTDRTGGAEDEAPGAGGAEGTGGAEGAGRAEDEALGAGGAEGTGGTEGTGGAEDEAPGAGGAEGTGGTERTGGAGVAEGTGGTEGAGGAEDEAPGAGGPQDESPRAGGAEWAGRTKDEPPWVWGPEDEPPGTVEPDSPESGGAEIPGHEPPQAEDPRTGDLGNKPSGHVRSREAWDPGNPWDEPPETGVPGDKALGDGESVWVDPANEPPRTELPDGAPPKAEPHGTEPPDGTSPGGVPPNGRHPADEPTCFLSPNSAPPASRGPGRCLHPCGPSRSPPPEAAPPTLGPGGAPPDDTTATPGPPASPQPQSPPRARLVISRRERRAMRVLPVVVGVFLLCWTPFFVVHVTRALCAACVSPRLVSAVTWLGYVNSALNPLIYTAFHTGFRAAFRKALRRRC